MRFPTLILSAAVAIAAPSVHAQTYPTQTVRIIVPFAPGGLNDTTARLLQPHLEKGLGQTVIVDNRPAASGIVGTDAVAKAAPDGHSLLMVASSHAVVPATNPKVPYNIERDFAAIALVSQNPFFLVVNAKVPAKTLAEFVALVKKSPTSTIIRVRAPPVTIILSPRCSAAAPASTAACAVSGWRAGDPVAGSGRYAVRGDLAARRAPAYSVGRGPCARRRRA